jgi:myo-inositol-1(or 4)-monophosphatase
MDYWGWTSRSLRQWEKEPGQLVSDADLLVDEHLKRRSARSFPDAAWLSEEKCRRSRPHRLRTALPGWSIPLTAPAISCADAPAGRYPWHWSERGEVVLAALVGAPGAGELLAGARKGRAPPATACSAIADRIRGKLSKRARARRSTAQGIDRDLVTVFKPNSIALRMAMVAADEADRSRACAGDRSGTSRPPR